MLKAVLPTLHVTLGGASLATTTVTTAIKTILLASHYDGNYKLRLHLTLHIKTPAR
jgi:hypothetical protein